MAQGVCWVARELGVPATVVAPDHAPRAKLDAIERLGGRVELVPFDRWWETMEAGAYPGLDGLFVHPVLDERVMAGNGVIGLELAERLDAIDTVLVPWGGGGLSTGHRERARGGLARDAGDRVRAGRPARPSPRRSRPASRRTVEYRASFVDGAGSKALLPAMWERARPLLAGAVAVPLARHRRGRPSARDPGARRRGGRGRARRSPPRSPVTAARAGSSASSRAATSTRRRSPTILQGETPGE